MMETYNVRDFRLTALQNEKKWTGGFSATTICPRRDENIVEIHGDRRLSEYMLHRPVQFLHFRMKVNDFEKYLSWYDIEKSYGFLRFFDFALIFSKFTIFCQCCS